MAQALDFRLELRCALLRAIELTELRSNPKSLKTPWIQMKAIIEPINESHPLGVPVPEAFSTKLQRRLASTLPPRPMVQLSFEETYSYFKRLFVDGIEVQDVLNYADSQSLLVRQKTLDMFTLYLAHALHRPSSSASKPRSPSPWSSSELCSRAISSRTWSFSAV